LCDEITKCNVIASAFIIFRNHILDLPTGAELTIEIKLTNIGSMDAKSSFSRVKIVNFFLFNSMWGPKEGEEEKKIVYFWPDDVSLDNKLKKIGLVEGVTNFATKFSSLPAHSLHTLKERLVYHEVEKNYWLCISVSVPNTRKQNKDSGDVIEFYPEDVSDEVLKSILRRSYKMFCLFHSGLNASLMGRCGGAITVFSELIDHFFSRYLATLNVERGDITYIWGGLQYLAVEMLDFLRVQSIINRLKKEQLIVSKCLFLQSGQLVWSDVDPEMTKLLVQYLSTTILTSLNSLSRKPEGSFLVGEEGKLPTIYLCDSSYQLAVYHVVNTTLMLLLNKTPPSLFYSRFKESPGQELGNLSADLTHTYISRQMTATSSSSQILASINTAATTPASPQPPSDNVMFLYYNASNLAVKSTVMDGHSKAIMLAQDLLLDLARSGSDEGEVCTKLSNDEWVVVQVAGARTIVVILTEKNINLIDVAESVNKLKKTSFDNICML